MPLLDLDGLPIHSKSAEQPASVALIETMASTEPFSADMLEALAGKALHALRATRRNYLAQGADNDAAMVAACKAPVTIELGVFMGFIRDALALRALLAQPARPVDAAPAAPVVAPPTEEPQ